MGADLYINNLPKENQITGFKTDIKAGYFRDSYNCSNLLNQFNLSYWVDIDKKYNNKNSEMTPTHAKKLLFELKKREQIFKKNIEGLFNDTNPEFSSNSEFSRLTKREKLTTKEAKEWEDYFNKKYKELKTFLKKAIKLNSNISCSL